MSTLKRRVALATLGVLLAVVLQLASWVGAPAASAHADLVSTTPVAGSQVDAPPREVTLTFSESVAIALDAVRVVDAQGRRVDIAAARPVGDDRSSLTVPLPANLARGSYAVLWHVVSDDGHPLTGAFSFGYGVPAAAAPGEQPQDASVQGLHWTFTALWYLGAALLVGPAMLVALAWPAGAGSPRLRRLTWTGLALAALATAALYVVQGPYGQSRDLTAVADPGLLRDTLGTTIGPLLLGRLLVLAVAVPALGLAPRHPTVPRAAAPMAAVALGLTAGLAGHAGQEPPVWLNVVVDAVHFAAATTWLGGLAALAAVLVPTSTGAGSRAGTGVLAEVLPRWSRLATGCVAVLVLSGGYQAWREVRSVAALTGSDYGRLLAVKVSGLLILLALAALGRRWVQRLVADRAAGRPPARGNGAGGAPGLEMLREVVLAEIVVGAVVLGLTASLVSTVPARQAYAPPFATTVVAAAPDGSRIAVTVDVSTTRAGPQEFHVYTFQDSATGASLPFRSIQASLAEPSRSLGPLTLPLIAVAPSHVTATTVVPVAGVWELSLRVTVDEARTYAATVRYPVTSG